MIVRNVSQNLLLGSRVERADSFARRLRGLMFRASLGEGEGLLIQPCRAVHTHFMRFAIDVIFIDAGGTVVSVVPVLRPWRQSPFVKAAVAVLELAAGGARATVAGDQLAFDA